MSWTITLIPPNAVDDIWPTVMPLLEPAIAYAKDRIDVESVRAWLADRRYLLWVGYPEDRIVRVAFVTREARYPKKSMLVIDLCGGAGMKEWAEEGTRIFRSFAHDCGLDGVEMFGRRGWSGALKNYGWGETCVLCEVDAAKPTVN